MPKKSGYGSKHMGKGVSKQMPNSSGSGRRRSGAPVSGGPKSGKAIQMTDRSNQRKRGTAPKNGGDY